MRLKSGSIWTAATLLASAGVVLVGCSNQSLTTAGTTVSANLARTMTQTIVTDAPADQVLSLSLTVDSIVLTDSAGSTTTILSTPVTVEASHLDAVQEPLLPPLNIPQDTYVSATFTVANPIVVYVDSTTGKPVKDAATLASPTDTVTFSSPIKVGASAAPIQFDLLVGQSVAISGATVTVTPTFNVTQIPLAPAPTNGSNGKVSGVMGQVVSTGTSSLVIAIPNGQQLTIATDSNTQLQGFTALSALSAGELVNVDVAQQTSGSLLAVRIQLLSQHANTALVGPVTAVAGSPATSFTQLVRQPLGPQAPVSATGTSYTINLTTGTVFELAGQAGTLPALPFTPVFSASTLYAGQNVQVVEASGSTGTTVTAESVTLAPQTVSGTVAAVNVVSGITAYTVTLPSQSALSTLTGAASVVVYTSISTQMMNASAVAVGSQVRFNGLLFSDKGTLKMVAVASADPAPAAPPQHP